MKRLFHQADGQAAMIAKTSVNFHNRIQWCDGEQANRLKELDYEEILPSDRRYRLIEQTGSFSSHDKKLFEDGQTDYSPLTAQQWKLLLEDVAANVPLDKAAVKYGSTRVQNEINHGTRKGSGDTYDFVQELLATVNNRHLAELERQAKVESQHEILKHQTKRTQQ